MQQFWLISIIVISSIILWVLPESDSTVDLRQEGLASEQCEATPHIRFAGNGVTSETNLSFFNNGFVGIRICTAASLRLVAKGTMVGGIGAHFVIHNNTELLWEGLVTDEQKIAVSFEPGWLLFSFLNDAATATEDRNLWIIDLAYDD